MTKNVLLWDGEWGRAQQIKDNLKKLAEGGKIKSLCLVREGQASFRTEDTAEWIPQDLSQMFPERAIEHEWANKVSCGTALWQDGRESRYTASYGSPEWESLVKSVDERTLACETLRDFRKKVDACWQDHVKRWRRLTLEQFDEHAAAVAAMSLCYKNLKALSWHHTWIAELNRLADPLEAVCSAWVDGMGERIHGESFFDQAVCASVDKNDTRQEQDKGHGPDLKMTI